MQRLSVIVVGTDSKNATTERQADENHFGYTPR